MPNPYSKWEYASEDGEDYSWEYEDEEEEAAPEIAKDEPKKEEPKPKEEPKTTTETSIGNVLFSKKCFQFQTLDGVSKSASEASYVYFCNQNKQL